MGPWRSVGHSGSPTAHGPHEVLETFGRALRRGRETRTEQRCRPVSGARARRVLKKARRGEIVSLVAQAPSTIEPPRTVQRPFGKIQWPVLPAFSSSRGISSSSLPSASVE